jgi:hypothetical protein
MVVPYEFGPNGGFVHPFTLLAAARYPIGAHIDQHTAPGVGQAASTARALVGIAGTAMEQLDILKNGRHPGFVVTNLFPR